MKAGLAKEAEEMYFEGGQWETAYRVSHSIPVQAFLYKSASCGYHLCAAVDSCVLYGGGGCAAKVLC